MSAVLKRPKLVDEVSSPRTSGYSEVMSYSRMYSARRVIVSSSLRCFFSTRLVPMGLNLKVFMNPSYGCVLLRSSYKSQKKSGDGKVEVQGGALWE